MLFGGCRGREKTCFLDFSLSFAIFLACVIGKPLMHQENGTELHLDILIFAKQMSICTVFQDPYINTTYIKSFSVVQSTPIFCCQKGTANWSQSQG